MALKSKNSVLNEPLKMRKSLTIQLIEYTIPDVEHNNNALNINKL